MTVSAPPRPPSPERTTPDSKPLEREEIEALVAALIEEARRETRRRHRQYWALAVLVALAGVVVLILLEVGAASQTAPALSARTNAASQGGMPKLAFTSTSLSTGDRNVPNPPPPTLVVSDLYVANADGSDKRLLKHREYIGYPDYGNRVAWSPDGQTIAFFAPRNSGHSPPDLFFVNADGSGQQRNVTREWGLDDLPVWSPDGKKIAFVSRRDGCRGEIYVMNADGRGLRRLTRNGLADALPIWSPDGTRIAFLRFSVRPACGGWAGDPGPNVYVMNADGGGQRRLARGWPSAWSTDGRKIAFTKARPGNNDKPGMYVMNADGTAQRRLNTVSFGSAAWSPNGQKILFVRARPGTRDKVNDIYVMNADGSGQRKLTQGFNAHWSADGKKISFVSSRDGNLELYVMNADGSGQVNVSQSPLRDERWHVWAPK